MKFRIYDMTLDCSRLQSKLIFRCLILWPRDLETVEELGVHQTISLGVTQIKHGLKSKRT